MSRRAEWAGSCARQRLIESNYRLIWFVVRRFGPRDRDDASDLFQAGCIGLVRAVDTFDPDQGTLATWARRWIFQAVASHAASWATPVSVSPDRVERVRRRLRDTLGDGLDEEDRRVAAALDALWLDASSSGEQLPADHGESAEDSALARMARDVAPVQIDLLMSELPPREAFVLRARWLDGRSQTSISSELGVSERRVGQLEKVAIRRLSERFEIGSWSP